jgi:HK97 family phage major capsid protein
MDIAAQTKALREQRMKAFNELNTQLEATAGRVRSEEEKAVIQRIDAEIDELDEQIALIDRQLHRQVEAETLREAQDKAFGDLSKSNKQEQRVDPMALFRQAAAGKPFEVDWLAVHRDRELLRAGASAEEIRVLNWQTSSGSLVVPTLMANSLYEYLEAGIAGFRIGATVVPTDAGQPLLLPKLGAHSIAMGTIPQGTTVAGTDPTFAQTRLDAYKYGQIISVSNEMLDDSAPDISAFIIRDIGRGMARQIDTFLITGSGSSQPNGMRVLAGSGTNVPVTTGGSLIAPTYEKFVDVVYSVNDAYRAEGAAWLVKDSVAGSLRKLRDGAGGTIGAVLWEPSLTRGIQGGEPDNFLGYPVYTDPNMAAAGSDAILAVFGHFGEYVIRTVGNPVVESDTSVRFATDETSYRGKWRIDGDHQDVSALNTLVQNV